MLCKIKEGGGKLGRDVLEVEKLLSWFFEKSNVYQEKGGENWKKGDRECVKGGGSNQYL